MIPYLDNSKQIITMLVNRHVIEEPDLPITAISLDNMSGISVSGPAFCMPYPGEPSADLALCSILIDRQSAVSTLGLSYLSPGAIPIPNTIYTQYGYPFDRTNSDSLMPVANYTITDQITPMFNPNPDVEGEFDENNWYWFFPHTLSGGGGSGGPIVDANGYVVAIETAGSDREPYYSLATPIPTDLISWYELFVQESVTYFSNQ
jgi:hypothetical protein